MIVKVLRKYFLAAAANTDCFYRDKQSWTELGLKEAADIFHSNVLV